MRNPYIEISAEEFTEQEAKEWFTKMRELYKEVCLHIHDMKIERWQLRNGKYMLMHEINVLKKENRLLKEEIEKMKRNAAKVENKAEKKEKKEKKEKAVKSEAVDFKKKFFDSL